LENGEVLKAICADDEMPDRSTVLRWIAADDGKRRRYEVARQACVEFWADDIISIATDGSRDTTIDEKGRARCDHEWLGRSRLRIDTIKFLMMKISPRLYGDRLPEAIQARAMEAETLAQIAATAPQPVRIELMGVTAGDVDRDAAGNPLPHGAAALRARIAELEAELAGRQPRHEAPKLLEHDPGLPRRLDSVIAKRLVQLVRDYTMRDQRAPETVLDEVLSVCRNALSQAYGPAGELVDLGAAAE
jgi:hypothetical protein